MYIMACMKAPEINPLLSGYACKHDRTDTPASSPQPLRQRREQLCVCEVQQGPVQQELHRAQAGVQSKGHAKQRAGAYPTHLRARLDSYRYERSGAGTSASHNKQTCA
jgi:hypothetical protein